MEAKDALSLVLILSDDVWKNWSYLITLNVAVLGWLLQRHGLYSLREKIISTMGYTGFVFVILFGMSTAYNKLDLASNELAYIYKTHEKKPVVGGLAENYVLKSPKYCVDVLGERKDVECGKYSDNLDLSVFFIFLGWLFNTVLFWYQGFWLAIRVDEKQQG